MRSGGLLEYVTEAIKGAASRLIDSLKTGEFQDFLLKRMGKSESDAEESLSGKE